MKSPKPTPKKKNPRPSRKEKVWLGLDVGTGSARAGLFTSDGTRLASASQAIRMWKPAANFVEQSSEDIWKACCRATRAALSAAGLPGSSVGGVGFDATCSLVVLDSNDRPVSVDPDGKDSKNVIVWMDHRAVAEADQINATRHPVLRYVGGKISPEMQAPKLLWIKKHLPKSWSRAARFLDLPDFLTYRATGDDTRSLCSVVCKWTYLGHKGLDGAGWDAGFFRRIGLSDLAGENFSRIGRRIRPMGETLRSGVTEKAAEELGIQPGTPVGVSLIDAHAGGLGLLGAGLQRPGQLNARLALIGGTSSCHMAVSPQPRFLRGIWGPYYSAMIPGYWLTEGGQSATGALIDHIIHSHPCGPGLIKEARRKGTTVYVLLNELLDSLAREKGVAFPGELTRDFHIQPDFHGNRSPRANPHLKGVMSGLTLTEGPGELAVRYLAAIQAVAYGTRHILEEMNAGGYKLRELLVCGGGAKNPVFLREHADITGCRLLLPREPEAVLLGSSILGAVAAGGFRDLLTGMKSMSAIASVVKPGSLTIQRYHHAKYRIFHRMHRDFLAYRKMMGPGGFD